MGTSRGAFEFNPVFVVFILLIQYLSVSYFADYWFFYVIVTFLTISD